MKLLFLGTGDAFGSGGRFNTCFHVTGSSGNFLIDCGASAMTAIRRFGVDPNALDCVFVTHLFGDHFGGLPFLILDAQFYSKRTRALTIAGPPGTRERLALMMEALFPGSTQGARRFETEVLELEPEERHVVCDVAVTPYTVKGVDLPKDHGALAGNAPFFAYRFECDGKVLAYTGDTEWCDALVDAGRAADLLIAEALYFDKQVRSHLDYATLRGHLDEIGPKRVILTHMGPDMLDRLGEVTHETAVDGMVVEI